MCIVSKPRGGSLEEAVGGSFVESRLAFPAVTPGSFNKVGTVSRSGWMLGCPGFFEISGNTCWEGYVD